ncbi:membrane protein [Marmoricola endophyticus]|uniref:Membrane protein n=1 Tax=Marmoricola endophyticus TaxID=2040280 RepID=A0A917BA02_9ACTN|nr:VWA domain-containing protein [Marmoricola endophyticus]GGF33046.1 membrane protein [Marmoricola endophyticus]
MSLASPVWLWLLVPVAVLAALYLLSLKRRSAYAVRFATLPMLERLVPRRAAWRRHLPAALLLVAFAALSVAAARPQADVRVPRERATVMVAIDVSLSMKATDVSPSRLSAARDAAKRFIDQLPDTFNVGVVEFAGTATVLAPPRPDKDAALDAVGALQLQEGTAIGEGVYSSLDQITALQRREGAKVPGRIVLLSDGTTTMGRANAGAAQQAAEDDVPVSTIAYGTQNGVVDVEGQQVPVPVDPPSLAQLAQATDGTAYTADTASRLDQVYDDIGDSIGYRTAERDVTPWFVAAGLLLAMVAAGLSLRWFARFP